MYKNYYSFLLFLAVVLLTGKLSAQENRFENTGNAGIGTGAASPSHRLSIETADTTTANMIKLEHKGIANSNFFLGTASATYPVLLQRKTNILESYTDLHISAANAGKIYFETGRTGATAPVRMMLDNVGLGIGTTIPQAGLHVTNVNSLGDGTRVAAVLGNAFNDWTIFGGLSGGRIRGSNEGYLDLESNAAGTNKNLYLNLTSNGNVVMANGGGSVGIGTASTGTSKLAVEGIITARRVRVTQNSTWPDFVFSTDYRLPSLKEVEQYIQENQHLKDIPSAAEVQKEGQDLGEMNRRLLQKVEELTLYIIDQQKQIEAQNKRIQQLEKK